MQIHVLDCGKTVILLCSDLDILPPCFWSCFAASLNVAFQTSNSPLLMLQSCAEVREQIEDGRFTLPAHNLPQFVALLHPRVHRRVKASENIGQLDRISMYHVTWSAFKHDLISPLCISYTVLRACRSMLNCSARPDKFQLFYEPTKILTYKLSAALESFSVPQGGQSAQCERSF